MEKRCRRVLPKAATRSPVCGGPYNIAFYRRHNRSFGVGSGMHFPHARRTRPVTAQPFKHFQTGRYYFFEGGFYEEHRCNSNCRGR